MILKDSSFFLLFDCNKFAEGIVSPIRIVYTLDQNFAELFGLILVGPVSGTFCLGQRGKVKKKEKTQVNSIHHSWPQKGSLRYLASLHFFSGHDNDAAVFLPDHVPEVVDGVR
jgi:hypothetical protein